MNFTESLTVEFKRELTDAIKKEIIAFANTEGGALYVGIEDDGTVCGIDDAHFSLEKASNMIHDSILPDILVHATLSIVKINNKDVLKIVVSRGSRRPYYLKKKGLKPSGVFIRYGTSVSEASEDNIRQMIMESDGTSFESMRAMNQALTFNQTTDYFEAHHVSFTKENMQSLGLITSDIIYTNLGLLLSDQCEHTIKCARYRGEDKLDFQDRKEFSGSVLSQIEKSYEYTALFNEVSSIFDGLERIEKESYPSYALREAIINAVTHRDYSYSGSTLIHIFSNRIEIVSIGGLVKGLTKDDIELGISQSRNPKLAHILYRLKWIESYGTGLQRIIDSYKGSNAQPSWKITPNGFMITLPKISITETNNSLQQFLNLNKTFTSTELENYLNKSKSSTRQIIQELLKTKVIYKVGKGPATKYIVH